MEEAWTRGRRVAGKAEYLDNGGDQRFVVTSLGIEQMDARRLCEDFCCARGDMENRTASGPVRGSDLDPCLLVALRRLALAGTEMAQAQCGTIRLRLLKIALRCGSPRARSGSRWRLVTPPQRPSQRRTRG